MSQQLLPEVLIYEVFDKFHIIASLDQIDDPEYHSFSVSGILSYVGFCDDFGPMNLGTVFRFCNILENEMKLSGNKKTAVTTSLQPRDLTNSVFLVGCYMIMIMGYEPDMVSDTFKPLKLKLLSYRDVSPGPQNFDLNLIDCWRGLWRAKKLSWVNFDPTCDGFDVEEYEHFDSPLNADLHEIVPGKFVAMRSPRSLDEGAEWQDMYTSSGEFSHRDFSAKNYADILQQFDVRTVIRLNAPLYEADELRASGMAVAELFFEDCTSPPVEIVAKFLLLAEHLPGAIAVHCKAGLGRTGTLIALYMMKHYGFTARAAMAADRAAGERDRAAAAVPLRQGGHHAAGGRSLPPRRPGRRACGCGGSQARGGGRGGHGGRAGSCGRRGGGRLG